ncbi:MAG TPA: phosphoenolpyruvate--protein phosphotransferase [Candidatus Kryptobacter bacterium]|nr:MAG: phosphoenolpyruvate--protein phosphotransferase [Ignavibacteriae bacterium 37-53-5]HQT90766.1 phosphoenolpyruvate--protein phosphotransferase [Candidatus Kryptobacter bacterium]
MNSDPVVHSGIPAELVLRGVGASPGIAIGKVLVLKKDGIVVEEKTVADPAVELERLQKSIERSTYELEKVYHTAREKIGDDKARIFEAQLLILSDPVFFDGVKHKIVRNKKNAEFVVSTEFSKQVEQLRRSNNEMFKQRAMEIEDCKNRILRNLAEAKLKSRFEGTPIVVTSELTPADAVLLSRNAVLGYVSDFGGARSHASILSRSLGIPAVVGLKEATKHVSDGVELILDGYRGVIIINPTESTLRKFRDRKKWCEQLDTELMSEAGEPALTTDGRRVSVEANIELLEELPLLKPHGADGIGLFRTEPLIIDSDSIPDEMEQAEVFRKAVEEARPNAVVFRTFDIGGDKVFVQDHAEQNPFLGWRGIRMMLDRPDLFREQFRAILRASSSGKCKIMYPMVATLEEVARANELLAEAKKSLDSEGINYDKKIEVGVMIEIPSAALMSREIAKHVDFLSIGTNDLTQYLLAVDRTNELVANMFEEFHPAVLRTIKLIIDSGHDAGIKVAMCGEMAGNPMATVMLLGMGLDEFSAVSSMLPVLKKIIRATNYKSARKFARQLLKMDSADEIKKMLADYLKTRFERIYHTSVSEENLDQ